MRIELRTPECFGDPVLHDLGTLILQQRESCTVEAAMRRYARALATLRQVYQAEYPSGGSGVPPVTNDQIAVGDDGRSEWRRCPDCYEVVIPGWICRCRRMHNEHMAAVREARNLTGAPLDGCLYGAAPEMFYAESDCQDAPVPMPDFDIERWMLPAATIVGTILFAAEIAILLYLKFSR